MRFASAIALVLFGANSSVKEVDEVVGVRRAGRREKVGQNEQNASSSFVNPIEFSQIPINNIR